MYHSWSDGRFTCIHIIYLPYGKLGIFTDNNTGNQFTLTEKQFESLILGWTNND